jgi:restriction system protein
LKLTMAKNSLFAILLRSSWWIGLLIAAGLALLSFALLPAHLRLVGALSGFPFLVVSALALRRQWGLPSATRIAQTQEALADLGWPAFSALLEQAFRREGYTLKPPSGKSEAYDFELERAGRLTLVSARRWKSARTGLEVLRALEAAREARGAGVAIYIGLAPLSEQALTYAQAQGLIIWQAAELAQCLRGLPLAQR